MKDTSERLFFLHASRLPTEVQRDAAEAFMREYAEKLHSIEKGEIPIPGGYGGYFDLFLDTVSQNTSCENVRIFASLRPLEILEGFRKFKRAELFHGLATAVNENKISLEYIVFLTNENVLNSQEVQTLLNEYTGFAKEVRVALATDMRVSQIETERTILLLDNHRWAFTHTWSVHADVIQATQWITKEAYRRFEATYKRLRLDSRQWFKRNGSP